MNQTLNARLKLNKCTIIGDVGDATGMRGFQRILGSDQIPRIFLQLLHTQRNAVGLFVDLDDLNLHRLANRKDFRGVVHTAPCHVGHVQQTVDTAKVHKRTVFGDVLDDTVHSLAFGQVANDFGALLGTGLFKDRTTRDNDVATATVHLQDLEWLLHTHQRTSVAHGAHIDLRAGQERNSAAQINGEAAFDPTEDRAFDAVLIGIGLLKTIPGFLTAGHFTADDSLATRVFDLAEEHLHLVAHFNLGGFAGICEFFQLNTAFHFVADVDDGLARFNRDDLAFDNRALVGRVNFEAFVQEGFEFLHGCVRHKRLFSLHVCFLAARLAPPVLGFGLGGPS